MGKSQTARMLLAGSASGVLALAPTAASAQDYFLGQVFYTAANFCPRGTATSSGQILPIAQNQALFSILGTTYGGNGVTTFALPDLRGRIALDDGTLAGGSSYSLGQVSGVETVTLNQNELPAHTHQLTGGTFSMPTSTEAPNTNVPDGGSLTNLVGASTFFFNAPGTRRGLEVNETLTIVPAGSSAPHENRAPYIAINACVVLQGIFPSRN